MLVVKRPFRNYGKVYTAGTVITDPADIKRLNGKIAEGKIIEVTEQTFETTASYFKEKYGVVITRAEKATESVKAETVKAAPAKKVVSATAK